ncbi:hypothetical protein [Streptomyces sp. MBT53]|uniref:hypothetical protein n=1 Tax=Streptomyces sp. MBT53 TaxID=1488384 RepID=UPI001F2667AE|nr:hypothetical protein [Streptomyces sp. MBT53]
MGRHANVGFVLVGSDSGSGSADRTATNVSWVPIDDGLRAAVTAAVERVVDAQQ